MTQNPKNLEIAYTPYTFFVKRCDSECYGV